MRQKRFSFVSVEKEKLIMKYKISALLVLFFVLFPAFVLLADDPTSTFIDLGQPSTTLGGPSAGVAVNVEIWDAAVGGTMLGTEAHTVDVDVSGTITKDTGFGDFELGRGSGGVNPTLFQNAAASPISRYLDVTQAGASVLPGGSRLPFFTVPFALSVPLIHNFGTGNLFAGVNAGNFALTGSANTGVGVGALFSNTTGNDNTASGFFALSSNTTGNSNTASGRTALSDNTTGSFNTASGDSVLFNNTGSFNTASGFFALRNKTFGDDNIAIGTNAGANLPNGFTNIYIGNLGPTVAESNTIRLGRLFGHNRFFAAGVFGVTTDLSNSVPVRIDSNGQLGTINSSRRFKEEIRDMGEASSGLMQLRPVTFRYKKAYADGSRPLEYGLIAEEVAEVYPDLVVYSSTGEVETVQYDKLNMMLLNEVQKQQREIQEQAAQIVELKGQAAENAGLKARLEALEGMVRNVAYQTAWSGSTE